MDWLKENWQAVGVIVLALHTLLKAIARVTKTKVDDNIVAKIGAIIGYVFGHDPSE